jgi:hypothetical protein
MKDMFGLFPQTFNKWMLDKFGEIRVDVLPHIKEIFYRKNKKNPGKIKEFQRLVNLFGVLDEWNTAKKAYERAENKESAEMPDLQIDVEDLQPLKLRNQLRQFREYVWKIRAHSNVKR